MKLISNNLLRWVSTCAAMAQEAIECNQQDLVLPKFVDFSSEDFELVAHEVAVVLGDPELCVGAGNLDDIPEQMISDELLKNGKVACWNFDYYCLVLHGSSRWVLEGI